MRATMLIRELQAIVAQYGDCAVCVVDGNGKQRDVVSVDECTNHGDPVTDKVYVKLEISGFVNE